MLPPAQLIKLSKSILGTYLFRQVMRGTFYGHFVAGEDEEKIRPVIQRLQSFGVKSILDYSAEEDISEERAVEVEMSSLIPESGTGPPPPGSPLANEELKQFKPQKAFADRRKFNPTARTYFYMNEAQCERNMETFLKCIDAVAGVTGHTGLAAIKLTALGRPQILLQLSEVIARTRLLFQEVTGEDRMICTQISPQEFQEKYKKRFDVKFARPEINDWFKHMDFDRRGLINLFSWNGLIDMSELASDVFKVPNLKTGRMENIIKALTHEEDEMFRNMMRRIHTIAQAAKEKDVRVMVDAEQSYLQPAINRITVELMRKYNGEKAIIFNTYQCYLKVRLRVKCHSLYPLLFIFCMSFSREMLRAVILSPRYYFPLTSPIICFVLLLNDCLTTECLQFCDPGPRTREEAKLSLWSKTGSRSLHGTGKSSSETGWIRGSYQSNL